MYNISKQQGEAAKLNVINNLKENGQHHDFRGYGGIENLEKYISCEYGAEWEQKISKSIDGIPDFKQTSFGPENQNNCTLASIARIMKYYSDSGFRQIPENIEEIYGVVREIGIKHGYNPGKSGLIRDIFIYTPFEIKTMVRETWSRFGYSRSRSINKYYRKFKIIKDSIDDKNPVLLNVTAGDYKGHTVTVTGYRIFGNSYQCQSDKIFVRVYDGWSENKRYIDWSKFGNTLASVTKLI